MANEKRLIDARKYFEVLRDDLALSGKYFGIAIDHLNEMPTVDAVEVVHGRWHEVDGESEWECHYRCSKCFTRSYELTNYCPNCGAKMNLEKE